MSEMNEEAQVQQVTFPTEVWKERWDMLILVLILYSACAVPFRIGFASDAAGVVWLFEAGMTVLFLCDVYLSFRTAYYDNDEGWVTDRKLIARRYLRGWFWIDAPSSFPLELVELVTDAGSLGMLRFLRTLRLFRLARLLKVDDLINQLTDSSDIDFGPSARLFMMIAKLVYFAHFLACFWFGVSLLGEAEGMETTWTREYDNGRVAEPDAPTDVKYMYSIYWALTTLTTVGYGDITPTNDIERVYTTFVLLSGALVFGFMVSSVGALVAGIDRRSAIVTERLDSVREYTKFRNLPRDLAITIKKHFKHYYTIHAAIKEDELLAALPPKLHAQVCLHAFEATLGNHALFEKITEPEVKIFIFQRAKAVKYQEGDYLLHRGQRGRELLMLIEGEAHMYDPFYTHIISAKIRPRQITIMSWNPPGAISAVKEGTGVLGGAVLTGARHSNNVVAATDCTAYILEREHLRQMFREFPKTAIFFRKRVLAELKRKVAIDMISRLFLLLLLPRGSDLRAVLTIQRTWQQLIIFERKSNEALLESEEDLQARMHKEQTLRMLQKLGGPSSAVVSPLGVPVTAGPSLDLSTQLTGLVEMMRGEFVTKDGMRELLRENVKEIRGQIVGELRRTSANSPPPGQGSPSNNNADESQRDSAPDGGLLCLSPRQLKRRQ